MSWSYVGPASVTDVSSLDSPDGVISQGEFDNLDFEFDFSCDTDWALSWLYFPNDYTVTGALLRLRMQIGGGQLHFTLDQRDASYTETNVFTATPANLATSATGTVRITRNSSSLVSVYFNDVLVNSGTHSASVPVVDGMVHFGNTTSGSTTTISNVLINAAADTTAPVLSLPAGSSSGVTTATGSVTTDEGNGTLYFIATANITETAAYIIANGSSQVVSSSGVQNVSVSGLSASSNYYLHYVQTDSAANQSNVVSSTQFTTDPPQLTVLTVSDATPQPGDIINITVQNDTGTMTASIPSGSLTINSQSSGNIAIVCPNPVSHGTRTSTFLQNIVVTISDGVTSGTTTIQIQPATGYQFAQIAALMANGTYLGNEGVAVGDWAYGHYTAGTGAVNLAISSVQLDPGSTYEFWIRDATDGVWSPSPGTIFLNTIDFAFTPVTGAETSTLYQATSSVSGADPGQSLTIVNGQLSNDSGSTWAETVTYVDGQTLARTSLTTGTSFSTPYSVSVNINGIAKTYSVTTRAPSSPVITVQPSNQNVTAGQNATFTVSATNATSYQWYEEAGSVDTLISGATSSSYIRATVLADNGKQFYCVITSPEGGTVTSSTASLAVQAPNVTLTSEPLRDAITKQLRASVANIPVRIRKADGSISFTGTVNTDSSGVFSITNNTMASAGETVSIEFPDAASGTYSGFNYTFAGG